MKKIRDILPAGFQAGESDNSSQESPRRKGAKKSRGRVLWIVGLVLFLGVGVMLALNFWSSLELTFKIKQDSVNFTESIVISADQTDLDLEKKILPGQFFEESGDKWLNFPSTGVDKLGAKAKGVITVYNAYNPPSPLSLKPNTRFLSSEGEKIFRAPNKIYLPAGKLEGGKITPSATDVSVEAYEAGADYNIASSKFSVPGLAGTAWYSLITGESSSAMTGGSTEEIKVVSEEDIEQAKEQIKVEIRKIAIEKLTATNGEEFYFSEQNIFSESFEVSCFNKVGEQIDEFKCEGTGQVKFLAVKKSDLEEISKQAILSQDSTKIIKEGSLVANLTLSAIDEDKEELKADATIEAEVSVPLDENFFRNDIAGKGEDQIKEIIQNQYPQITDLTLKFWPFWVSKAPKNLDKIKITISQPVE